MHSAKQNKSLKSLILSLLVTFFAQTAHAKSVYVITNHGSSIIKAYDIQDDQIQYQVTAENLANHGGAVGLALDPDSEMLFVTYEGSNIIEIMNAKTMEYLDTITALNATNRTGIDLNAAGKCLN